METIFIINPHAGQGTETNSLTDEIKEVAPDAIVYITKAQGDAERFVREHCLNYGPARFIACGGDGTLNEVLNGAVRFEGAQIGVLPIGSGNDFCRNFGNDAKFKSVLGQMIGGSIKCDVIKYSTTVDGTKKTGYCANMINIGFDCNVADKMGELKTKPFISGSFAYILSIFINLVKKKGANLKIELDGTEKHSGPLLLTSVANGSFCGGGIYSNPLAEINDGMININVIKNVSRIKFLSLLPHYMKGTFLQLKGIEKMITSEKCRKVKITPLDGKMKISNDGEITDAEAIEFEIVHNAMSFVLPKRIKETVKMV